ncbi:MAG: hypothetical protein H0U59_04115 [Gemmatimonadaceae bacterium]|nr:hypothetical protein [Gemmatimonadaceae bacterium]
MPLLSPQQAIALINHDLAEVFNSPTKTMALEKAVEQFVQSSLDAFVERQHLDMTVRFSLTVDPKRGYYMATLSGTF